MPATRCENCKKSIPQSEIVCTHCGFPQGGTKAEKITYNGKLLRLKDLIEDSDKSVKGILSVSIIFFFMALIVLLFSLFFRENYYANVIFLAFSGGIYFLLNRLGKRSSYLMAALALIFYLAHTIVEFSNGMYLKSPVDLNKSFVESKGVALIFALIPLAYMIYRFALMIVLTRFLWIELKLKSSGKMVDFLRKNAQESE